MPVIDTVQFQDARQQEDLLIHIPGIPSDSAACSNLLMHSLEGLQKGHLPRNSCAADVLIQQCRVNLPTTACLQLLSERLHCLLFGINPLLALWCVPQES